MFASPLQVEHPARSVLLQTTKENLPMNLPLNLHHAVLWTDQQCAQALPFAAEHHAGMRKS